MGETAAVLSATWTIPLLYTVVYTPTVYTLKTHMCSLGLQTLPGQMTTSLTGAEKCCQKDDALLATDRLMPGGRRGA